MSSTVGTMTQRPPDEHEREDSERKRGKGFSFPLGVSRTQQMGNRGLAAASIGWTLAGCILVGFVAGSWLDKRFGTTYWTPVLFLVGVVAGFREMFRSLAQISQAPSTSQSAPERPSARAVPAKADAPSEEQVLAGQQRQRVFSVPPPPFLEQPEGKAEQMSAAEVARRLRGAGGQEGQEKSDAV